METILTRPVEVLADDKKTYASVEGHCPNILIDKILTSRNLGKGSCWHVFVLPLFGTQAAWG